MLLDEVAERELTGEHREDVVARDELEIIDDRDVARIRHRDRERAAVALEGQVQLLRREIVLDQLDDPLVDLEPREVDRGHPVLTGDQTGELVLVDVAELHEAVTEPHAALRLLLERTRELLFGDEPFPDES